MTKQPKIVPVAGFAFVNPNEDGPMQAYLTFASDNNLTQPPKSCVIQLSGNQPEIPSVSQPGMSVQHAQPQQQQAYSLNPPGLQHVPGAHHSSMGAVSHNPHGFMPQHGGEQMFSMNPYMVRGHFAQPFPNSMGPGGMNPRSNHPSFVHMMAPHNTPGARNTNPPPSQGSEPPLKISKKPPQKKPKSEVEVIDCEDPTRNAPQPKPVEQKTPPVSTAVNPQPATQPLPPKTESPVVNQEAVNEQKKKRAATAFENLINEGP
ncbi:hypothetical protein P9112_000880 [Eukaryota sp. TZLM1-RC]